MNAIQKVLEKLEELEVHHHVMWQQSLGCKAKRHRAILEVLQELHEFVKEVKE